MKYKDWLTQAVYAEKEQKIKNTGTRKGLVLFAYIRFAGKRSAK